MADSFEILMVFSSYLKVETAGLPEQMVGVSQHLDSQLEPALYLVVETD